MLGSSFGNCDMSIRVETQSKMTMMREKAVKDLDQYNAEMKDLERVIAHESNLKAFMSIKSKNAGRQEDEQEVGPRRGERQPVCRSYSNQVAAMLMFILELQLFKLVLQRLELCRAACDIQTTGRCVQMYV